MTFPRLALLTAILFLTACAPEAPPPPEPAAEKTRVMELEHAWMEALQAGDIDAAMGFIASEPQIIVPNAPPIEGRDAFRGVMEEMIADAFEYSWKSTGAVVAPSGDMAYDWGRSYVLQPDGSTLEGNYLVVWVREDGEWKVAVDMVN